MRTPARKSAARASPGPKPKPKGKDSAMKSPQSISKTPAPRMDVEQKSTPNTRTSAKKTVSVEHSERASILFDEEGPSKSTGRQRGEH